MLCTFFFFSFPFPRSEGYVLIEITIEFCRGDSAFCSLECRQQQMNQDERKDKFFVASKKQVVAPPSGSQATTKGETVAAS